LYGIARIWATWSMSFDVPHERVDGGQASVSRGRTVLPVALEVLQERQHELRVQLLDVQLGGPGPEPLAGEVEEESERVGVRLAGARALALLDGEVLAEEGREQRRERRHGFTVHMSASVAAEVSCMSDGVA
jgi:hypothetical protein